MLEDQASVHAISIAILGGKPRLMLAIRVRLIGLDDVLDLAFLWVLVAYVILMVGGWGKACVGVPNPILFRCPAQVGVVHKHQVREAQQQQAAAAAVVEGKDICFLSLLAVG